MKDNILFIGPMSPPVTGPGVKNYEMISVLKNKFTVKTISTLDSWNILWLLKNLYLILKNRKIIYSVSEKGRYVYSALNFIKQCIKVGNCKSILYVAGGSLDKEIIELPSILRKMYIKFLTSFDFIVVESEELVVELNNLGLDKAVFMPNGRCPRDIDYRVLNKNEINIVFLSKVREGKGILRLMEAMKICEQNGINVTLDIYGIVENDESFKSKFFNLIDKSNGNIKYRGVCDFREVQQKLCEYDALVFPSLLPEGMPGIIIEALTVNLPIITTDFRCRKEILTEDFDCLVTDKNSHSIADKIEEITNIKVRMNLSKNSNVTASKYNLEELMQEQIKFLSEVL